MKKEELLSKLKERFEYVAPINFKSEQQKGLIGPYIVDVLERIGESTAIKKLVRFYIKDLNMDSEEVIFDGWNPFAQITTTQTFTQEVQAYTKRLIDDGTYEYITVEDVNETMERAFCWAYSIDSNKTLVEKAIIVYRDDTGKITHREAMVV